MHTEIVQFSFTHRLKNWREDRGFSFVEAAAYINARYTGGPIAAAALEKFETGGSLSVSDRHVLEFFMSAGRLPEPVPPPIVPPLPKTLAPELQPRPSLGA
jgi:hypothetical protein